MAKATVDGLDRQIKLLIGAAGLLATWLAGISAYLYTQHGDIEKIKQGLADHGIVQIVAELKSPKSLDQLQANLSTVIAQIQTARVEGRHPDETKVTALSGALSQVVKREPELPEAWQASIQLVNYKYQAPKSSTTLPNCLDTLLPNSPEVDRIYTNQGAVDYPEYSGPQTRGWMSHVFLGHCSLSLDDDGNFSSTPVGRFFDRVKKHHPQATLFFLVINNAHISYSGGKMLPVSGIQFVNCSFEFKPPNGLPNKFSQSITSQLLAENPSQGTIQLPIGM